MAYLRNPVYMWGGASGEKREDDMICVSLPRGKFRRDVDGCDFRRMELLATALAFLDQDYPDMLTRIGKDALKRICAEADRERGEEWKRRAERLGEFARRDGPGLLMLLTVGLNPDDWAEDLFEKVDGVPIETAENG
jgi:hypothetical protein